MNRESIPVGFGFALAMNPKAMEQFAAMDEQQKQTIVDRARQVNSKWEMQSLVKNLASGDSGANNGIN